MESPTQNSVDDVPKSEDPLIAALPPNTDYITYLTILEYQLTPKNLPTLNRLLQEDDGTLASEIGWDLLKLVLPILRVDTINAKKCLDTIARRGNPREVIVRVAEELESLGQDDSDTEANPLEREDGLPTFVGEAPHVHLGSMTLAGMPDQSAQTPAARRTSNQEEPDAMIEELKLQALLSMLGELHPRIKTQYPSRFMATSLPAALKAYRNLSMNPQSTDAFLNTLTKLSGRRRPMLPPRVSSADLLKSAPLPDPEAKSDPGSTAPPVSDSEAAIIKRLLQAVLLEIIDEHTTVSAEAQPPLTARLRTAFEPDSLTSNRKAELESLLSDSEAKRVDELKTKFVTVAADLGLDVAAEIANLNKPSDTPSDWDAEEQEPHEYPTSPSEIPLSATALLLLYSTQMYNDATVSKPKRIPTSSTKVDLSAILELVDRQYETDLRLHNSAPAIDSLLTILYLTFCTDRSSTPATLEPSHSIPRSDTVATDSQTLLLATHNTLRDIFTTSPDPDLRDNAYHIASHLLHGHCRRDVRLKTIRSLLESDNYAAVSPIHGAQTGSLKAIGVGWLKDEAFPTPAVVKMMRIGELDKGEEKDSGLERREVEGLGDLIFPVEKVGTPPAAEENGDEEKTELFVANLPFYIAGLNLLSLVIGHREGQNKGTGVDDRTEMSLSVKKGSDMVQVLSPWRDYLSGKLVAGAGEEGSELEGANLPDIFALEDAISRATVALQADHEEI